MTCGKDKSKKLGEGNRYVDKIVKTEEYQIVFRDGRVIVFIKKEKLSKLLHLSLNDIEKLSQKDLQQKLKSIQKVDYDIK